MVLTTIYNGDDVEPDVALAKNKRTLAVHGYHGTSAGLDSESKRQDEGSVICQSSIVHDEPEFHIFDDEPEFKSQQKRASTDAENYPMPNKKKSYSEAMR